MVNRVEGQELGSKQTVNPIETVKSSNLKDRRRHNDDSKHQDKVRRHSEMWARKKAANPSYSPEGVWMAGERGVMH
jgi:hypothetical protein